MAQDAGQAGVELAAEMRAVVRGHNEEWGARGSQMLINDRLYPDEIEAWAEGVDALAAQVAALQAELSAGTVGTLTAELAAAVQANERLTAERDGLLADLIHFAQTNHQAHHPDHSGTWLSCDRGVCAGLRRAVSRAHSATTPAPADAGPAGERDACR